jgi:hypothetical protein
MPDLLSVLRGDFRRGPIYRARWVGWAYAGVNTLNSPLVSSRMEIRLTARPRERFRVVLLILPVVARIG